MVLKKFLFGSLDIKKIMLVFSFVNPLYAMVNYFTFNPKLLWTQNPKLFTLVDINQPINLKYKVEDKFIDQLKKDECVLKIFLFDPNGRTYSEAHYQDILNTAAFGILMNNASACVVSKGKYFFIPVLSTSPISESTRISWKSKLLTALQVIKNKKYNRVYIEIYKSDETTSEIPQAFQYLFDKDFSDLPFDQNLNPIEIIFLISEKKYPDLNPEAEQRQQMGQTQFEQRPRSTIEFHAKTILDQRFLVLLSDLNFILDCLVNIDKAHETAYTNLINKIKSIQKTPRIFLQSTRTIDQFIQLINDAIEGKNITETDLDREFRESSQAYEEDRRAQHYGWLRKIRLWAFYLISTAALGTIYLKYQDWWTRWLTRSKIH
jgi:hypothetical protein